MTEHLRVDDKDGIRILTIDRPESKNALHGPLRSKLCAAVAQADLQSLDRDLSGAQQSVNQATDTSPDRADD